MKVGIIGDPHLGCIKYTDKRASDFSYKFNACIDELVKRNVDLVVILGDVFDSSAYRRNIDYFASNLSTIADSLLKLKRVNIPVFAIAGNHEYGRGRIGGELIILKSLDIINFLEDEIVVYNGLSIGGISWKSNRQSFLSILEKIKPLNNNSILLIHQFCDCSMTIPKIGSEVRESDFNGWGMVIAGHHHQYEDLGYALIPGSLEVHTVTETREKGFLIYDTETKKHEFIPLKSQRLIRFAQINAEGKSAAEYQKEIEDWILANAKEGALIVIKIEGTLKVGRQSDIKWRYLRSLGIRNGCIKVHFDGGLKTPIRTAPEIRAAINFDDYIEKRFADKGKKASQCISALREKGEGYSSEIIESILKKAGA